MGRRKRKRGRKRGETEEREQEREKGRKEGRLLSSQFVCSLSILNRMHQPLFKQSIFWSQIKRTANGTFAGCG